MYLIYICSRSDGENQSPSRSNISFSTREKPLISIKEEEKDSLDSKNTELSGYIPEGLQRRKISTRRGYAGKKLNSRLQLNESKKVLASFDDDSIIDDKNLKANSNKINIELGSLGTLTEDLFPTLFPEEALELQLVWQPTIQLPISATLDFIYSSPMEEYATKQSKNEINDENCCIMKLLIKGHPLRKMIIEPMMNDFGPVPATKFIAGTAAEKIVAQKQVIVSNRSLQPQDLVLQDISSSAFHINSDRWTVMPGQTDHINVYFRPRKPNTVSTATATFLHPLGASLLYFSGIGASAFIKIIEPSSGHINFGAVKPYAEVSSYLTIANSGMLDSLVSVVCKSTAITISYVGQVLLSQSIEDGRSISQIQSERDKLITKQRKGLDGGKIETNQMGVRASSLTTTDSTSGLKNFIHDNASIIVAAGAEVRFRIVVMLDNIHSEVSDQISVHWECAPQGKSDTMKVKVTAVEGFPKLIASMVGESSISNVSAGSQLQIDFGLTMLNRSTTRVIELHNDSEIACRWQIDNLPEHIPLSVNPEYGDISMHSKVLVEFEYSPSNTEELYTTLRIMSDSRDGDIRLLCTGSVGVPQLKLPSNLHFDLGIIAAKRFGTCRIPLRNTGQMPISFKIMIESLSLIDFHGNIQDLTQNLAEDNSILFIDPSEGEINPGKIVEVNLSMTAPYKDEIHQVDFQITTNLGEKYQASCKIQGGESRVRLLKKIDTVALEQEQEQEQQDDNIVECDFGQVKVGSKVKENSFYLINEGNLAAKIIFEDEPSDANAQNFAHCFQFSPVQAEILPNQKVDIQVVFLPDSVGHFTRTLRLSIQDEAIDTVFLLVGRADQPLISIDVKNIHFGSHIHRTVTKEGVSLKNLSIIPSTFEAKIIPIDKPSIEKNVLNWWATRFTVEPDAGVLLAKGNLNLHVCFEAIDPDMEEDAPHVDDFDGNIFANLIVEWEGEPLLIRLQGEVQDSGVVWEPQQAIIESVLLRDKKPKHDELVTWFSPFHAALPDVLHRDTAQIFQSLMLLPPFSSNTRSNKSIDRELNFGICLIGEKLCHSFLLINTGRRKARISLEIPAESLIEVSLQEKAETVNFGQKQLNISLGMREKCSIYVLCIPSQLGESIGSIDMQVSYALEEDILDKNNGDFENKELFDDAREKSETAESRDYECDNQKIHFKIHAFSLEPRWEPSAPIQFRSVNIDHREDMNDYSIQVQAMNRGTIAGVFWIWIEPQNAAEHFELSLYPQPDIPQPCTLPVLSSFAIESLTAPTGTGMVSADISSIWLALIPSRSSTKCVLTPCPKEPKSIEANLKMAPFCCLQGQIPVSTIPIFMKVSSTKLHISPHGEWNFGPIRVGVEKKQERTIINASEDKVQFQCELSDFEFVKGELPPSWSIEAKISPEFGHVNSSNTNAIVLTLTVTEKILENQGPHSHENFVFIKANLILKNISTSKVDSIIEVAAQIGKPKLNILDTSGNILVNSSVQHSDYDFGVILVSSTHTQSFIIENCGPIDASLCVKVEWSDLVPIESRLELIQDELEDEKSSLDTREGSNQLELNIKPGFSAQCRVYMRALKVGKIQGNFVVDFADGPGTHFTVQFHAQADEMKFLRPLPQVLDFGNIVLSCLLPLKKIIPLENGSLLTISGTSLITSEVALNYEELILESALTSGEQDLIEPNCINVEPREFEIPHAMITNGIREPSQIELCVTLDLWKILKLDWRCDKSTVHTLSESQLHDLSETLVDVVNRGLVKVESDDKSSSLINNNQGFIEKILFVKINDGSTHKIRVKARCVLQKVKFEWPSQDMETKNELDFGIVRSPLTRTLEIFLQNPNGIPLPYTTSSNNEGIKVIPKSGILPPHDRQSISVTVKAEELIKQDMDCNTAYNITVTPMFRVLDSLCVPVKVLVREATLNSDLLDNINFGPLLLGQEIQKVITLENISHTTIEYTLQFQNLVNSQQVFKIEESLMRGELKVKEKLDIPVIFSPIKKGVVVATLAIVAAEDTMSIELRGQGDVITVECSHSRLDFGTVSISTLSTRIATVHNRSALPLHLVPIQCPAIFHLNEKELKINPHDSIDFTVSYCPALVELKDHSREVPSEESQNSHPIHKGDLVFGAAPLSMVDLGIANKRKKKVNLADYIPCARVALVGAIGIIQLTFEPVAINIPRLAVDIPSIRTLRVHNAGDAVIFLSFSITECDQLIIELLQEELEIQPAHTGVLEIKMTVKTKGRFENKILIQHMDTHFEQDHKQDEMNDSWTERARYAIQMQREKHPSTWTIPVSVYGDKIQITKEMRETLLVEDLKSTHYFELDQDKHLQRVLQYEDSILPISISHLVQPVEPWVDSIAVDSVLSIPPALPPEIKGGFRRWYHRRVPMRLTDTQGLIKTKKWTDLLHNSGIANETILFVPDTFDSKN